MVWFKIDDGFWSHSKVLDLSAEAGWLWARAGSYCANQLTDGRVTPAALRMLSADRDSAVELVMAGLWDEVEAGWVFHDWAEYQPTREQVLVERAAAAERKRASREKSRLRSQGESRRDSQRMDAVIPGGVTPTPTRPDPTRPIDEGSNDPSSSEIELARTDVESLCTLLADLIEANGSKRPTITKGWRDAARLMLDRDGRAPEQLEAAIRWCQADPFWRSNILSMAKLREKYDQLRLAAARTHQPDRRPTRGEENLAYLQRVIDEEQHQKGISA